MGKYKINKFSDLKENKEWHPEYQSNSWKALKKAIKDLTEQGKTEKEIQVYINALFNWDGLNDDTL
jgi:hypothetical protein